MVAPCCSLRNFTEPCNLSTRTQGFCMLVHGDGGGEAWGVDPTGNGRPERQDSSMKVSGNFINFSPSKSQVSILFGMPPSPGGFLLSTLAPKWAAWTMKPCTQHCVSRLRVPREHSTPTRFSTAAHEVMSCCATKLLTARTVHCQEQKEQAMSIQWV